MRTYVNGTESVGSLSQHKAFKIIFNFNRIIPQLKRNIGRKGFYFKRRVNRVGGYAPIVGIKRERKKESGNRLQSFI